MSDLGAIFHVKKNGVQYDAHAYTTLDECPAPNLKLTYKGQQAYVKLEAKGGGDVPCYVKPKSGSTVYQVKKTAAVIVPTGSVTLNLGAKEFIVPAGVTRIKVVPNESTYGTIIGVTPLTKHLLDVTVEEEEDPRDPERVREILTMHCKTHKGYWSSSYFANYFTISWSPEINKQTPKITDY